MKILFLQKNRGYSGAEKIILTLMVMLKKYKLVDEVAYASPVGSIENHLREKGLKYIPLKNLNPFEIRKVINGFSPEIIHASDYTMSILAALTAGKIPVIAHLHSNPEWLKQKNNLKNIAFTMALKRLDKVVVVSNAIEHEYCHYKSFFKKFIVIPNIVDISEVQQMGMISKSKDKYDLVFLGRFYAEKGPISFLKIVKDVKTKYNSEITGIMVGDGELKKEVMNFIVSNDLVSNVLVVGYKSNPYKYVNMAKIGIIPSKMEGFGLAAVEMLTLGKPVLCSGVGGLKEIINDDCGKICENLREYSEEINKLIDNKGYYKLKSKNAKKMALNYSNKCEFVKSFVKVYKEVSTKK